MQFEKERKKSIEKGHKKTYKSSYQARDSGYEIRIIS